MTRDDLITAALALLDPARWQVAIDRTIITADASETSTGGTVRGAVLSLDVRGGLHGLVRVEYGLVDVRPVPSGAGGQQCVDLHRELCEVRAYVSPADALTMIRMAAAHAESMLDEFVERGDA